MRVIDVGEEHRELFALCLEDWSDEAREAGPARARWIERFTPLGLRAKLALDDDGKVGGMIQYLPIERSFVDGEGLYMIPCIWVHGHKQGRGDCRGRGMGRALLEAAEADARALGARGMAAWGLWLPFWMRASWFKKHGYRKADRQGMAVLMWKPFTADARPPRWFRNGEPVPQRQPGRVTVTAFANGWCMAGNLICERARRAAAELGPKVAFQQIDTSDRETVARWALSDALFVDGKPVRTGPPPTYDKLKKLLTRKLNRLPSER